MEITLGARTVDRVSTTCCQLTFYIDVARQKFSRESGMPTWPDSCALIERWQVR